MTIRVIGAGFGRTGTASLKMALEQLGFGPTYHMSEVLADPGVAALWEQAANGNPDWDTTLAGYQSTTDFPACTYWQELMHHYPEAKVVLTVRDPQSWFESVHATILGREIAAHTRRSPLAAMFEGSVWSHFGDGLHDRDAMVEGYERHCDAVRTTVPPDRLLEFDVKQGWAPLCRFLDAAMPTGPFPRVNSRDETAAILAAILDVDPEDDDYDHRVGRERHRLFADPGES